MRRQRAPVLLVGTRGDFRLQGGRVEWLRNPIEILAETYRLLNLDGTTGPAAHRIWSHDRDMLETGLRFYGHLAARVPKATTWGDLDAALRDPEPHFGFDAELWPRVRAAHAGHQTGLEILSLLPMIAEHVGFYDLRLNDDLTIDIPERLHDPKLQEAMRRALVPPPVTKADEIVATMGGTYYAQEAPTLPHFVERGRHFEKGQPLYIIEVMKMFNKVYAPFSGTVDAVLVESGTVVRKGQALLKVTPDEVIIEEAPHLKAERIAANTDRYLARLS